MANLGQGLKSANICNEMCIHGFQVQEKISTLLLCKLVNPMTVQHSPTSLH